jgi:hypothetical protein
MKQHNTGLTGSQNQFDQPDSLQMQHRSDRVLNRLDRLADLVSNTHSTGKACFSKQSDTIQDYKYNKAEIDCMTQGLHTELKHA